MVALDARHGPAPPDWLYIVSVKTSVLLDFDNTAGIQGYEIDDALALLYLAGRSDVEIVGITTTFGNGSIEQVYEQSTWLLDRLGIDVPIYRGASRRGDWETEAARFIADICGRRPGDVRIVALGPLSNLAGAAHVDPAFFRAVGSIYLMGGYLDPLRFPRRSVSELNISSDPEAAAAVLESRADVHVMTAQLCLGLPFTRQDLRRIRDLPSWFRTLVGEWYLSFTTALGAPSFYLWDLVPPLALLRPEFVPPRPALVLPSRLEYGMLRIGQAPGDHYAQRSAGVVNIPVSLADHEEMMEELYGGWATALSGR